MVTIPDATEVRSPYFDFLVFIARAQYRDPLHLLLEYIMKVSATVSYHHLNSNMAQRAPDCHMAVVHDDDLERVLRVGNSTVSEDRE